MNQKEALQIDELFDNKHCVVGQGDRTSSRERESQSGHFSPLRKITFIVKFDK